MTCATAVVRLPDGDADHSYPLTRRTSRSVAAAVQRTFLRLKEAKYYSGATLPRLVAATVTVEISARRATSSFCLTITITPSRSMLHPASTTARTSSHPRAEAARSCARDVAEGKRRTRGARGPVWGNHLAVFTVVVKRPRAWRPWPTSRVNGSSTAVPADP